MSGESAAGCAEVNPTRLVIPEGGPGGGGSMMRRPLLCAAMDLGVFGLGRWGVPREPWWAFLGHGRGGEGFQGVDGVLGARVRF